MTATVPTPPPPADPTGPSSSAAPDPTGRRLGRVLRAGVVSSAALVVGGVAWNAATGGLGGGRAELARRLDAPPESRSLASIALDLVHGRPEALVLVGLLVLVATPILRVAVAGLEFHRQRDRAFTVIALLVLGLLATSVVAELAA